MVSVVYKDDIRDLTKQFAIRIIKYTIHLKTQNVEYAIRDQLLRSGTSIGANVIEAKSSSTRKEYIRYYEIALKSANETKYWLELIDEAYKQQEFSKELVKDLETIRKIIASIVINLKKNNKKK
jgi:four helix bundle protein